MKAIIQIPLSKENAQAAMKSLESEAWDNKRVKTSIKTVKKGLKITVESGDVNGLRAGVNTVLKLYKLHDEVKKWSINKN